MASPADHVFEKVVLEAFRKPKSSDADQARALQMVSQLPNPGAVRDKKGRTLLYYACKNDWSNVATLLMDKHTPSETLDPTTVCLAFTTTGIDEACIMQLLTRVPNPEAVRDKGGSVLLHYACEKKWNDVARTLLDRHTQCNLLDATIVCLAFEYPTTNGINQTHALQLLSHVPNPATVRDRYGTTLLHWACLNQWYDVVKALVEEHGCDPSYQPGFVKALTLVLPISSSVRHHSSSVIHCACEAGSFRIVKYLVEQGCDPMCRNFLGATPLHVACLNGHLDIVKFLVTEHHCNPLQPVTKLGLNWGYTPLHAACEQCHLDVVAFLLSTGKSDQLLTKRPGVMARLLYKQFDEFSSYSSDSWWKSKDFLATFVSCRRKNPFNPAFKVFVMGNPSAGKSTLVKAVQNKLTSTGLLGSLSAQFKKVSGVKLQTAGIIPVLIESETLGNIIMYDLAGQYQYYSSHAALLEQLVSSPGALLMVVVDLSKSKEEIIRTLEYWNSFIENCYSQSRINSKSDVVIIGSHADMVKSSDVLVDTLPALHKIIPLNCLRLASGGLSRVCSLITTSCVQFQQKLEMDLQVHFLFSFLAREFKGEAACRVSQIASRIAKEKNAKMEVRYHNTYITLLPQEICILSMHLTTLSENGWFLYLRDRQSIEDSWVILDQEVLLSEVNGTIFAPENFKEHHDISNSTGVVPFSKIEEAFPRHNPKMIINFLTYLELCQQVAESEALVISEGQLGGSQQLSETYYFFPSLVSEIRPKESCKSLKQTHYKCGWSLQCVRSNQFLSPRFLHVLLLRLAFSFALAPEIAENDKTCPVLQRRCNVWKAGIHWQNRDGVEAIVEVVDQNTAVAVMMGCLKGREVACVELRSKVIQTILDSKERFCGAVELRESFIHPSELASYPVKSPQLLSSFTITELATAITQDKQVVTCKNGPGQQMLEINELLYFEPYASFNATLLAEIFSDENSDKNVPDLFHRNAGKFAHTNIDFFMQALDFSENEFEAAISHITTRPYRDNGKHHCYLLFRTWTLCSPNPTYQALRSALDRFSVFCGRNPLLLTDQVPSKQSSVGCRCVSKPGTSSSSHVGGRVLSSLAYLRPLMSPSHTRAKSKTKPTRKSLVQEDASEDLTTSATHKTTCDRPLLQELQCLRGRGGRKVRVIEGVAAHWEDLALSLDFESSVIDIVRRDMFHQSEDACREILRRWLEGQTGTRQPVNWATLIDSLLEAGFVDVVEDLQDLMASANWGKIC